MESQPQVTMVPTVDRKPYKRNAKIHSEEQVEMLAASIQEFGFNNPILIDDKNGVIAGHGRLLAAKKLELEKVPCIYLSHLTEEQKRAYILADNRLAELAEWDDAVLDLELLNIEDIDMSAFGFGEIEIEEEDEPKEKKPKTLESMELKAFEHYDYLVFVFDNQMDWMNACDEFGIHKVDAGYGDTKKVGVGRVIKGAELLKRLRHSSVDNQQGQEPDDSEEHLPSLS